MGRAGASAESAPIYEVHGVRLRSEVPLSEPKSRQSPVDIEVRWGEPRSVPDEHPKGTKIVHLELPGLEYVIADRGSGYTARFPSLCEFRIAADVRSVTVHPDPAADPELAALLLTGNMLAFVLGCAGKTVLHASAVEASGSAIAILGGPGMGKSTLAAHLCLAGANLVTDDALRVELDDGRAVCYLGTREVRLRSGAAHLATRFPPKRRRQSADGRIALRPGRSAIPKPPIGALVTPVLSEDAAGLRVRRLRPKEALLALLSHPRLIGWRRAEELRPQFVTLTRLAEEVPVLEAVIPWAGEMSELGPPLLQQIAQNAEIPRRLHESRTTAPA